MATIKDGDAVVFLTGKQVPESPLPSFEYVRGVVTDAGTGIYPRNPTVLTRFGSIEVLRSALSVE